MKNKDFLLFHEEFPKISHDQQATYFRKQYNKMML